jgi:hypothetical protein
MEKKKRKSRCSTNVKALIAYVCTSEARRHENRFGVCGETEIRIGKKEQ